MITLPNGSIISIASGYSAAKAISDISNANPGVAASTAHGFADGAYLELVSGWSDLTDRIFRVDAPTTNNFALEGQDTTSTSRYPIAGGLGSARSITGWTQLAQILDSSSEGGEQQFYTGQFLEARRQFRIPTTQTPTGITFTIADDPALPGQILAQKAADDRLPRAVMLLKPDGSRILYNAYISVSAIPSLNVNEPMSLEVSLSLLGDPVRYPN